MRWMIQSVHLHERTRSKTGLWLKDRLVKILEMHGERIGIAWTRHSSNLLFYTLPAVVKIAGAPFCRSKGVVVSE